MKLFITLTKLDFIQIPTLYGVDFDMYHNHNILSKYVIYRDKNIYRCKLKLRY